MPELPNSLEEAIAQSSEATKAGLADGYTRIQVDLLFPELKFMVVAEQFLPLLAEYESRLKVFFADAGAAALARRDWVDAPFQILDIGTARTASIQSKIQPEDEIILFVSPTSVEVPQVEKICEIVGDRPTIFLNPRLEDASIVGIGYTARQTRQRFLSTIEPCYYLRPVDDETALFRSYPGEWQVWVESSGTWTKIAELPKKPSGDELDTILMKGQPQTTGTDNTTAKKPGIFKSWQRFIKALSN